MIFLFLALQVGICDSIVMPDYDTVMVNGEVLYLQKDIFQKSQQVYDWIISDFLMQYLAVTDTNFARILYKWGFRKMDAVDLERLNKERNK